ncbi:MAG: NFACT RNA binding domain-containing protein [Bacillota bacterium]|nr:NFACT RNA binding domain-containing protein [Bacillota bacterium]
MAFDGLVTGAVARQLASLLTGGRIDKIYQPADDELVLHVHRGREKYKLYISSNSEHPRIHLTEGGDSNPQSPPAFCMLLRKHFQGGKISSLRQVDSERIVELSVEGLSELGFPVTRRLMVEIMGRHSNIIAVDGAGGKIIDAIKRVSPDMSRVRQVFPGQLYSPPPSQDKLCLYTLTEEALAAGLGPQKDQVTAKALVAAVQGISPVIGEEIVSLAGGEGLSSASRVFPVLRRMAESIEEGRLSPAVYLAEDGTPLDFHIFPLSALAGCSTVLPFPDAGSAAAYYYSHRASSNRIRQKTAELSRIISAALDKQYLKKQRLLEDLLQAEKADEYRIWGELLTAHGHQVAPGAESASLLNYYTGEALEIPLDPRFSAVKNAQRYFKKYGKAKTALKEKKIQLKETDETIAYLESVAVLAENAESTETVEALRQELTEGGYLRRRKAGSRPAPGKTGPLSYSVGGGFSVLVGRSNQENDLLTFKLADRKDLWLHTKDIPGSHVILQLRGQEPTESAIFQAAAIAAWHSKARGSENVPVDYTFVRYVKKPAGARPGMVIFTDNRTVYVSPALPADDKALRS